MYSSPDVVCSTDFPPFVELGRAAGDLVSTETRLDPSSSLTRGLLYLHATQIPDPTL